MGSEAAQAAEALNWAISSPACPPLASPHPILTLALCPFLHPPCPGPQAGSSA